MNARVLVWALALASHAAHAQDEVSAPTPAGFALPASVQQAVVVLGASWESERASLRRYEKVGDKWMQLGAPVDVTVGRAGLAWGLGLHPLGVGEPRKVDDDDRAPAGVFRLALAAGTLAPPPGTRLPFLAVAAQTVRSGPVAPPHVCVTDPRSPLYNRLTTLPAEERPPTDAGVDDGGGEPPGRVVNYRTALRLTATPDAPAYFILVDHNHAGDAAAKPIRGRGACAFLMTGNPRFRADTGATLVPVHVLDELLTWLDPTAQPVLVQLPVDEYKKRRAVWALP